MNRRAIASIKFRLRNEEYELPMGELKAIYGTTTDEFDMPWQFRNSSFWNEITLKTDGFKANRAKSSMIRNPVLRMIQKACISHPFARTEMGSIQKDELFLLWCLVHGRRMNMVHFMVKNVERASRRTVGTICCGVIVGAIVRHLRVNTRGFQQDLGPTLLDFEALRRSHDIGVSLSRKAYFLQRAKDHFPLPDPINTYIRGSTDKRNWQMNSPVHQAIVAAHPTDRFHDMSPDPHAHIEHAKFSEQLMVEQQEDGAEAEEENEEEAGEDIPPYGGDEAGTSSQRRRSRREREEEDYASLNERLTWMELRQEEYWAQNDARLTQYETRNEARWNQFETNWNQFTEFNTEQWANINARFDEFRGQWQHPPPPPQ
ncbi:uncharacterized protein LOC121803179 [Salvia splendens]|uniref:uncharacterized protein LOC121803179 n=1 Tax=Salvia splendens TaxID=180675 RepID=UPI001C261BB4|nr:uncharacterized protein LOC121803179 [Salvia splendens]